MKHTIDEVMIKHHKNYFKTYEKGYYPKPEDYRQAERKYIKDLIQRQTLYNITELKEKIQYQRGKYNVERI